MQLSICRFKRTQESPWEIGLMVGETILDEKAQPVPQLVWDIKNTHAILLNLEPLVESVKQRGVR